MQITIAEAFKNQDVTILDHEGHEIETITYDARHDRYGIRFADGIIGNNYEPDYKVTVHRTPQD